MNFRYRILLCFAAPVALAVACSGGDRAFSGSANDGGVENDGSPFVETDAGKIKRGDSGELPQSCVVPEGDDNGATLDCTQSAPPDSFQPKRKWIWSGNADAGISSPGSMATPLVGNFTDDNHDKKVDLCDVPDVLVTVSQGSGGKIVMLAGDNGRLERVFDGDISPWANPAFGDLDGDGVPEIVASTLEGYIVAYRPNGSIKWTSSSPMPNQSTNGGMSGGCHALAIYDLDGDGQAEILSSYSVFDSKGNLLFSHNSLSPRWCQTTTAADLDGDGKLEVLFGNAAYHHDGTVYWDIGGTAAQPHVANLDDDPDPEVFLAREDGLLVLEHDGKIKFGPVQPVSESSSQACWTKPGAIHDFDGDGIADISASTCTGYGVYTVKPNGLEVKWLNTNVHDGSGSASNTAFDFLGLGMAQAIYGDETSLWVFDGKTGAVASGFPKPRSSGTIIEYPVVADVDNDQSADILVVSSPANPGTIEVFEDAHKRWMPTRRIWNQHAYHVTNVREDGTIPKVMKKSWQNLNTFRTNAQISGTGDCRPPVPNPK